MSRMLGFGHIADEVDSGIALLRMLSTSVNLTGT
jgi:hypothetical protein